MAATIRFACATCHEKLSVPAKYAGRKGVCPSCQSVNRVPDVTDAAADRPAARGARSGAQGGGVAATPDAASTRTAASTVAPVPMHPGIRETTWRSVDPPAIERPPAAAAPTTAPPLSRPSRGKSPAPESAADPAPQAIRASAPAAWPDEPPPAAAVAPAAWPEDQPARKRRFLTRWMARQSEATDAEASAPLRREWDVDEGGLPKPVKISLLVLAVLAFGLLIWGAIYGLLWLLVPMNE